MFYLKRANSGYPAKWVWLSVLLPPATQSHVYNCTLTRYSTVFPSTGKASKALPTTHIQHTSFPRAYNLKDLFLFLADYQPYNCLDISYLGCCGAMAVTMVDMEVGRGFCELIHVCFN